MAPLLLKPPATWKVSAGVLSKPCRVVLRKPKEDLDVELFRADCRPSSSPQFRPMHEFVLRGDPRVVARPVIMRVQWGVGSCRTR